jgi:hypothetical protein
MIRNYEVSGQFLVSSAQAHVLDWNFYDTLVILKIRKPNYPEKENVPDAAPSSETQKVPTRSGGFGVKSQIKGYLNGTGRFFMTPGSSIYPRLLGLPYNEMEVDLLNKKPGDAIKIIFRSKSLLELVIFVASICILLFLYLMMWPGFFAAIKENRAGAFLLLSVIFYFAFASAPFTATERYRLPIMPAVILLSCRGLAKMQKAWNGRKVRKNPAGQGI